MSKFRVMFSENKTYTIEVEIDNNDFQEANEVAEQRVRSGDYDDEESNGLELEDIELLKD